MRNQKFIIGVNVGGEEDDWQWVQTSWQSDGSPPTVDLEAEQREECALAQTDIPMTVQALLTKGHTELWITTWEQDAT